MNRFFRPQLGAHQNGNTYKGENRKRSGAIPKPRQKPPPPASYAASKPTAPRAEIPMKAKTERSRSRGRNRPPAASKPTAPHAEIPIKSKPRQKPLPPASYAAGSLLVFSLVRALQRRLINLFRGAYRLVPTQATNGCSHSTTHVPLQSCMPALRHGNDEI